MKVNNRRRCHNKVGKTTIETVLHLLLERIGAAAVGEEVDSIFVPLKVSFASRSYRFNDLGQVDARAAWSPLRASAEFLSARQPR
jgi:hypothetical protein